MQQVYIYYMRVCFSLHRAYKSYTIFMKTYGKYYKFYESCSVDNIGIKDIYFSIT